MTGAYGGVASLVQRSYPLKNVMQIFIERFTLTESSEISKISSNSLALRS